MSPREPARPAPVLRARDVRVEAPGRGAVRRPILHGVDLDVAAGEFVVLAGPNGAGKTTLLRALSGERRPDAGAVTFDGTPLRALPAWKLAARRAVMAQAADVPFPFTAAEVVGLGVEGVGAGLSASARAALVAAALREADVAHLAARAYPSLSGGERQRVQFARAVAQLDAGRTLGGAQALLLDEPVSSLDLSHQAALLAATAARARAGTAVIAVLHDLNLALAFATRLVVLRDGAVAADGPPATAITAALLRDVFALPDALHRLDTGALCVLPAHRAAPARHDKLAPGQAPAP